MFKLLFTTFWPVLIPSVVYFLWWVTRGKQKQFEQVDDEGNVIIDVTNSANQKSWVKTPLFWVFTSSIGLLIISFLWLGITEPRDTEGKYIRPYLENGEIRGGHTENAK